MDTKSIVNITENSITAISEDLLPFIILYIIQLLGLLNKVLLW